ncbi:DUF1810 domain-containing protein [Defluviimonas salinarum]|uniref:DUF1810 domain-containing protein n=1 Tax=Defluviimonas salinarum TaxID=2992147 RepID=A0ABT3IZV4_9RHOB|nr:DUF1810 domain-containing protein [Defluviimonas salinarum]MCW3780950.1 DUF1810 domain-containing protein [Defluviimonas salinarum]
MPDLSRFHDAQGEAYETALAELRAGAKLSHWMWFIFPQLRGLGRSPTAQYFGIEDLAEARAYLADPELLARLTACAEALLLHDDRPAEAILGPIDALKLRSSATLFREAATGKTALLMQSLLDRFHGGHPCRRTLEALAEQ